MASKLHPQQPLLLMLYGLPGSGKSTFARQLTEHLDIAHIHADKIRHQLFENPAYDKHEDSVITTIMDYMAEEFLSAGVSVIYDTTALRRSQRMKIRELARKKKAKPLLIWFQIDADSAFTRLKKRDKRKIDDKYAAEYTPHQFKHYGAHMQHPQNEDYAVVSGKHVFNSQKNAVIKKMMEMGLVDTTGAQTKLGKPGLVNLIPAKPKVHAGRFDVTRRNINIR